MVKYDPDAVVFMDRSLAGDMAFAMLHHRDGNLNDEEWALYQDESQSMVTHHVYRTPLAALYFTAMDATLKQRVWERGGADKDFYNSGDPEYLARLDKVYPLVMTPEVLGCPVIVIPWERDHSDFSLDRTACGRLLDLVMTPAKLCVDPALIHLPEVVAFLQESKEEEDTRGARYPALRAYLRAKK